MTDEEFRNWLVHEIPGNLKIVSTEDSTASFSKSIHCLLFGYNWNVYINEGIRPNVHIKFCAHPNFSKIIEVQPNISHPLLFLIKDGFADVLVGINAGFAYDKVLADHQKELKNQAEAYYHDKWIRSWYPEFCVELDATARGIVKMQYTV